MLSWCREGGSPLNNLRHTLTHTPYSGDIRGGGRGLGDRLTCVQVYGQAGRQQAGIQLGRLPACSLRIGLWSLRKSFYNHFRIQKSS